MERKDRPTGGLRRGLSVANTVALAVSDISPTVGVLVVIPLVIAAVGSGSAIAMIVGALIALCVALCMAELGALHPSAGGLYVVVERVLGRLPGFLTLLMYVAMAVFLPATIALGIGTYISQLFGEVPDETVAVCVVVTVTVLAALQVKFNAQFTGLVLIFELVILVALTIAGLSNLNQPLSIVTEPVAAGSGGGLDDVTTGAIVAALATTLFVFNGFDSAINFSEETDTEPAGIARAVLTAFAVAAGALLLPFLAALFGTDSIVAFVASSTPLTDVARQQFGDGFVDILTFAGIVAIFMATLAIILQFSRILWASGREGWWPGPISRALAKVHPTVGTPWVATLVVGALAALLCLRSNIASTATFTGMVIIIVYGLVAIAALVSRFQRGAERPFSMPVWPLPPVLTLVGVGVAVSQQQRRDLLIVGLLAVGGAVYFFVAQRFSGQGRELEPAPESSAA